MTKQRKVEMKRLKVRERTDLGGLSCDKPEEAESDYREFLRRLYQVYSLILKVADRALPSSSGGSLTGSRPDQLGESGRVR